MPPVTRFEDLVAWQEARRLHQAVVALCRRAEFKNEYRLVGQMLAAGRSVGANIAEGFERFTPGEFSYKLYIAKGEVGELRSFLYAAHDEGRIPEAEFKALVAQTESVSRLVGALRASVAKRKPHD
ncbi:MAG TPA: four helix bundle protein [Gemmatimonadales bacterium]|nr:four helix bundle protein [Gemmatimonadales bacterium]